MAFDLRKLTQADADAAAAIHVQGFPDPWSASSIAGLMDMSNVLALGAEAEGRLQAFALFQSAGGETELLTIATASDQRGKGIAGTIIREAMSILAEAGNDRMLLDVAEDNYPALNLYLQLGFTEDGRRPRYYSAGRDVPVAAILMSCKLNTNVS